jgi:isoleucyl-tRNA synthetase
MSDSAKKYKATLQLPESPVPMKANLPTTEPRILAEWEAAGIYRRLREKRRGAKRFLLHDGPPYANGELHMGHALNKSLKDIIVRFRALSGFDTPFVPGWDCHGLPIEHNVMKESGEDAGKLDQVVIRMRCRAFAEKFVDVQRTGFKRLGCIGDWDRPYLTMDALFESRIIEAFQELHARGFIYRGLKPIHWCPSCRTALAASTAEAEYDTHTTDAITVAFPSADDASLSILIWTTTPWTLPANLAVAVRSDLNYVTVRVDGRRFLLAEALLPRVATECGWSNPEIETTVGGTELEGRAFRHPFLDRTVKAILGDFVTTEQGTGVVHIAPGHGLEDYIVGLEYGLEVLSPVDEGGRFTAEAGILSGENVFEANPKIVALLRDRNALVHAAKMEHSYPHCWRCKGPVIFRATRQWFMSIDHSAGSGPLRRLALEAAERIEWIPNWGKDRFVGSVRERPDWCLSRQRSWGVPIPALICPACNLETLDEAIITEAATMAREGRLDAWFEGDGAHATRKCERCGGALRRERDILDVWFDSGVSWFATEMIDGGSRAEGAPPIADLYLEGSDQHRGWFQSSLWPSLAMRGVPPYRAVLTHGFMLDGQGRAMHKSAGNAISPDDIMRKYGADIIRLWVASENYREDLRLSHEILAQVADTYRKIRNTWKFLAAHLQDLPEDFAMPLSNRLPIDRWASSALTRFVDRARKAYESYAFHEVYRAALEFFTNDLSSFYLDILKDRLYCDAATGPSRRAAQITCREIHAATLRVLAPILCFSTDEIWQVSHLAKSPDERVSIHLSDWPAPHPLDEAILKEFEPLLEARGAILKAIEEERAKGVIKSSAMAEVVTRFDGDLDALRDLCQVASVVRGDALSVSATELGKCPRCWRHREFEGELCGRCRDVVAGSETA